MHLSSFVHVYYPCLSNYPARACAARGKVIEFVFLSFCKKNLRWRELATSRTSERIRRFENAPILPTCHVFTYNHAHTQLLTLHSGCGVYSIWRDSAERAGYVLCRALVLALPSYMYMYIVLPYAKCFYTCVHICTPTRACLTKVYFLTYSHICTCTQPQPSAPASTQSLGSSQGPIPTHPPAAPPTDDFGDFQQGHQSVKPSFPPQIAPPPRPSPAVAVHSRSPVLKPSSGQTQHTGGDKYGVFEELKSSGSGLLSQKQTPPLVDPPSGGGLIASDLTAQVPPGKLLAGEKYSVFDELRSASSGEATPVPASDLDMLAATTAGSAPVQPQVQLPLSSAQTVPAGGVQHDQGGALLGGSASSITTTTTTTTAIGGDFGSFSLAPLSSSTSTAPPQQSQTSDPLSSGFADFASFQSASSGSGLAPVASELANSDDGWANFSSSQHSSSHQFPTSTLLTMSSNNNTKSMAESAFDSLLPPELLPSKAPKSPEPVVPSSTLGSLESKPSVTTAPTDLDFGMFESEPSPESKQKIKKQLTGLEVLEEEFSARVSAKAASALASASIQAPLVPESAPLDEFGDFEAYSSPGKEEKKMNLPLASIPAGESSPVLKKASNINFCDLTMLTVHEYERVVSMYHSYKLEGTQYLLKAETLGCLSLRSMYM